MEEIAVIWTETARRQLQDIYKYIAEDSLVQADKVFEKIVSSTSKLALQPNRFPPDKYKTGNAGDFRAYEIFHYRISYKITAGRVYIVRVRSTHQNPELY